jgi:hypothetical protein
MLRVSRIAPAVSPITGVDDGKSRWPKSVAGESTDLASRTAIPNHSRPARRFVVPFSPEARISGPDPERKSYSSYVAFQDPDGNAWIVQEITQRAPGRELPK